MFRTSIYGGGSSSSSAASRKSNNTPMDAPSWARTTRAATSTSASTSARSTGRRFGGGDDDGDEYEDEGGGGGGGGGDDNHGFGDYADSTQDEGDYTADYTGAGGDDDVYDTNDDDDDDDEDNYIPRNRQTQGRNSAIIFPGGRSGMSKAMKKGGNGHGSGFNGGGGSGDTGRISDKLLGSPKNDPPPFITTMRRKQSSFGTGHHSKSTFHNQHLNVNTSDTGKLATNGGRQERGRQASPRRRQSPGGGGGNGPEGGIDYVRLNFLRVKDPGNPELLEYEAAAREKAGGSGARASRTAWGGGGGGGGRRSNSASPPPRGGRQQVRKTKQPFCAAARKQVREWLREGACRKEGHWWVPTHMREAT